VSINYVDRCKRTNHYTTPPPITEFIIIIIIIIIIIDSFNKSLTDRQTATQTSHIMAQVKG